MDKFNLPDVQATKTGFFNYPIGKVGVRNIKVPFTLSRKENGSFFTTTATISSYCNLVEDVKGINMSRISRTINDVLGNNDISGFCNLNDFVYALQRNHNTDNIFIKAAFDYIVEDKSPISKETSYEPYQVVFESILKGDILENYISVRSIEMSLCPCSKEMSLLKNNLNASELEWIDSLPSKLKEKVLKAGFGAHNQKSDIEIKVLVKSGQTVWIEDLINIIRLGSSTPAYSTLKRPDEKYATETSYMGGYFNEKLEFIPVEGTGPKFVEDISRDVANKLNNMLDRKILDYVVVVNNQESIHSGDITATAIISAGRKLT